MMMNFDWHSAEQFTNEQEACLTSKSTSRKIVVIEPGINNCLLYFGENILTGEISYPLFCRIIRNIRMTKYNQTYWLLISFWRENGCKHEVVEIPRKEFDAGKMLFFSFQSNVPIIKYKLLIFGLLIRYMLFSNIPLSLNWPIFKKLISNCILTSIISFNYFGDN